MNKQKTYSTLKTDKNHHFFAVSTRNAYIQCRQKKMSRLSQSIALSSHSNTMSTVSHRTKYHQCFKRTRGSRRYRLLIINLVHVTHMLWALDNFRARWCVCQFLHTKTIRTLISHYQMIDVNEHRLLLFSILYFRFCSQR